MSDAEKMWGSRFKGEVDPAFARFNRSFGFDRRLFAVDVRASIAHGNALVGAGVLAPDEAAQIRQALERILQLGQADEAYFDQIAAEDVHSFVEARLIELTGDLGRKLHTGRSRNDQVATDLRLWLREAIEAVITRLRETQTALLDLAEKYPDAALPGYTHLQRAQPILFAHWCLAYFEMFSRDRERLREVNQRVNVMPLGSAALAGTSYRIDREAVARELGFANVSNNSVDAVSDRDFCVEFVHACALVMVHLSRLTEDVILYATTEFGFIELSDAVATGSSLMPQKKNPDSLELVRGKAGRVFGDLVGLLTMLKGLPLAYNKDMQEDKEAVFDAFDSAVAALQTTQTVLRNSSLNEERAGRAAASGYMNATELADYLVRKGMPFREAHQTVGRIVMKAIESKVELHELPIDVLHGFSRLIDADVLTALSLESTLASKSQLGGTAPEAVAKALAEARGRL
ncbi:MAG TPA: argininosuccinate lyase [Pyrinomonadaceae bacterium]|nr:argininosuccinate lyase [Pyrinomonadaceae bacterium]